METAAHAVSMASPDAMEDLLHDGVAALDIDLGVATRSKLLAYLALLAKWNRVYNLTSVRDVKDMIPVHLLDSLSIVGLVDSLAASTVLDVGSGAGLPGIPLAIARPSLTVTTVDAVAKKIAFQQQVKLALSLHNLHPEHARVEALALSHPQSIVVSRAYAALPTMLASVERLCAADTIVIAMKGETPADEIAALPDGWTLRDVRPLEVPMLGARRCAVVMTRTRSR